MKTNWTIDFDADAAKELKRLDKFAQKTIVNYLQDKIVTDDNPRRFGAPLKHGLIGLWKYRIGCYRLICKIEDYKLKVLVITVGHRKHVYKKILRKPNVYQINEERGTYQAYETIC